VQVALSALDRLEVRGRDSAGLHLLVRDHGLDLSSPGVRAMIEARAGDPLFRDGAVRTHQGHLSLVYKAAAEIGELGDNTRALRAAITLDELLHLALASEAARVTVLGHTRWASVGIISQANAHPLNSEEDGGRGEPYVVAALNGDVDNFADLKASDGLRIAAEITTDAKVIPTLVSRRLREGVELREAFRHTVSTFEGSVAIAASTATAPDHLLLALRGSGQALYVGIAEDAYIVASEPYGLVEETSHYIRLDGETPASEDNAVASRGQIMILDGSNAGRLSGLERIAYDGTVLPIAGDDIVTAQITTRDIDRGSYSHFLLKELSEAPTSFRKTLRGKIVEDDSGRLDVVLGHDALPTDVRADLTNGAIRRIVAIGQGTAHVAGLSFAAALSSMVPDTSVRVDAVLATELSGFGLRDDMRDTLIVAISQSGTTTDTNRTVDVARARGARVVAIVNRRNSDLTDKADGVLYTSDGRDVEMSVASTKALYAQIAAGFLLAASIAELLGGAVDQAVLAALRELPQAMQGVVERRADIAAIAQQLAPPRRYWAIVGNGTNRIAAAELRIKLSELCYKAIACDSTEDKKHIDLSSEPLILVCAAGLSGSTADDVAKEVAIFRAHKATPIVIASDGEERFSAALQAIKVPPTHPRLAFVLSAMAGHLFGYEAALAIDAQARPLREARAAIEREIAAGGVRVDGARVMRHLRPAFEPLAARFFDGLRAGAYDGHLEASTAVRLASLFRYALGVTPLESYQVDYGRIGTPAVVIDDLIAALTRAIEELTRPIDAIKHQAKTVTVGISRSDETLLQVPLAAAVLAAGAPRDALSYKTLRTLAALDAAVEEVTGWIRYRLEGDPSLDEEVIATVVDRGGIAAEIPSRTERSGLLRGTKHTVAIERELFVTRGRVDGRTIIIIPETKDNLCTGITLLHVRFEDRLPVAGARNVLQGYRNRYATLKDAVTETEPTFREDLLADLPVADLLTLPIHDLANNWRSTP
jgi:glucosamine--fructose-6-phosphate aminotransferase (isomerizing)